MWWSSGGKGFERWTNLVRRSGSSTGGNFDHEHSFLTEEKDHISMQITQAEAVRKQNLICIPTMSKIASADYNQVLSWQILPILVSAACAGTYPEVDEIHNQNANAVLIIQGAHPLLPCPALAPSAAIFLSANCIPFFATVTCAIPVSQLSLLQLSSPSTNQFQKLCSRFFS
jgi:hypothetical protein